jgi:hypothetical protein
MFRDEGDGNYGQNLAYMTGSSQDPIFYGVSAVRGLWYNGEFRNFQFYGQPNPPFDNFASWGHFTQVVWKGTQFIGCATHQCPAGTLASVPAWYTVCNYREPGELPSCLLRYDNV